MNERETTHNDDVRLLLVEAGPPPELPADDLERIRRAARHEWRGQSGSPIFEGRSSRTYLALAASLLLALGAVWLYTTARAPLAAATVATVELLRGDGDPAGRFSLGDELAAGTELTTGSAGVPDRVALRMASGHSVRLDAGSRIRLTSATRLELEHGAVYVDSGVHGAAQSLEVVTSLGTVREIGTQYEVRINGMMHVRVREGSVSLSRDGRTFSAARGEQLMVARSGGVDRSPVEIFGPDWSWVLETTPGFDSDVRTIGAYLEWVSREGGWELRYDDPALEAFASETVYGDISRMSPEESLEAVLPSSGLGHRLEGGVLVVTRADRS